LSLDASERGYDMLRALRLPEDEFDAFFASVMRRLSSFSCAMRHTSRMSRLPKNSAIYEKTSPPFHSA